MVRISDTLKQQNDLTSFPVAYGEGIWLNKDKTGATENYSDLQTMYNNDELGSGGSSIQVDILPIPSEDEVGNIYQYIAESGTYKNGYFYRCDSFSYLGWEDGNSNVVYTKDLKNAVGKKVYTVSGGTYSEVGTITELADDNSTMTYDDGNGNTIDCTRNNSYDVSDAGYTWTEIVYSSNLQEGDGIDITNDTISVVDRLVVTDTMPTASASLLDATRLFVGTTTSDFIKGGIYECQEVAGSDPTEYAWVLISTNPLEAGKGITIEDDVISADTNIFSGTLDEWNALTPTEQAKYDFIATPDEAVEDIADAVIDGDMRAITSNAVAQVVPSDASASNQLVTVADITKYFVISNSDVNVGESYYTNVTNSFEVFKIVADTIFNDIDASGELTPYVGHATAYTTDNSGYPNMGVTTWVASACMGANGHPYIRIRIFVDGGGEYIFRRSQDGIYALSPKEQYSTGERLTDKTWIDGKPIYRKVIDLGALPNATTKTVNHGISNLDVIINWYGYAERPSDGGHFPLPYVFGGLPENNIGIFASQSAITITTGMDRSAMYGFIVLEYTKTTN